MTRVIPNEQDTTKPSDTHAEASTPLGPLGRRAMQGYTDAQTPPATASDQPTPEEMAHPASAETELGAADRAETGAERTEVKTYARRAGDLEPPEGYSPGGPERR